MLIIAYEPVAFSQDSGARLVQPDHLRCSWSELVWAAVTVGRSNLRHVVRPETYPYLELLHRSSMIFENLQAADYRPGLWEPADPLAMTRAEGVRFDPGQPPVPVENGRILQGFVERSNVDPVTELTRMIEVQRAYELGRTFLDREDERVRTAIRTIGQ